MPDGEGRRAVCCRGYIARLKLEPKQAGLIAWGVMADREFRVVVAGAGVSGLFMAETLKRARINFTVYEKAAEVGGTWRDNTFPGLFVDVLSRQYEFPFQPNYDWSRKYAPAREIWAYIKKVARDKAHPVVPG
jgi:cation diffusion facilitator CzcD-associated flavoprotein CzcO